MRVTHRKVKLKNQNHFPTTNILFFSSSNAKDDLQEAKGVCFRTNNYNLYSKGNVASRTWLKNSRPRKISFTAGFETEDSVCKTNLPYNSLPHLHSDFLQLHHFVSSLTRLPGKERKKKVQKKLRSICYARLLSLCFFE